MPPFDPDHEELASGMHQTGNSPGPYQKERRHRRFELQFPVCLSFPSGGKVRELQAVSQNLSIGGLLLSASDQVAPHTRVTVTIDVSSRWSHRPVRLLGQGEVVRVEALGPGAGFAIAIECRQSITKMKDPQSAAS